ncbi:MAG: hypothetical protein RBU28_04710 [Bacteroidales bacterium]|jgi:hypothetical protein|nr:hypothetical protein [Bacteroidales bacterium]
MKTLNLVKANENLNEFALSNEEMFAVRGGGEEGTPILLPNPPTVKI